MSVCVSVSLLRVLLSRMLACSLGYVFAVCLPAILLLCRQEKLDAYIAAGDLQPTEKDACVQVFEQMRNIHRQTNLHGGANAVQPPGTVPDDENRPLTEAELRDELRKRERMMQEGTSPDGTVTDQWRVYSEAIAVLGSNDKPLRLVLQASAGTGKSFLLETLFLWCHLHGHTVRAAAPTGIAAARLRLPRTPVHASTLHWLMGLSIDGESTLDPTNAEDEGTKRLASMTVLMLDEASMIDAPFWRCVRDQLSSIGATSTATASRFHPPEDAFGRVHLVVALDMKQLPPATSQPQFFATDPEVFQVFDFRVLRQNRRLAVGTEDLEAFHGVLEDVAHGKATSRVRKALVRAFLHGAGRNQTTVKFENGTACVITRMVRDRWNTHVLKRIAKRYGRSLRVKAAFLARGAKSH